MAINIYPSSQESLEALINQTLEHLPTSDVSMIIAAFDMFKVQEKAEPFSELLLNYSLNSAVVLASWSLPVEYVICPIVSNLILSNRCELIQISRRFGNKVAAISSASIEISRLFEAVIWKYLNAIQKGEIHTAKVVASATENKKDTAFQKKASAVAPDAFMSLMPNVEIAIVKLVERMILLSGKGNLVNDRLLKNYIAQQSIDVYAVVAEMLGIWSAKWQIEDEALKILSPKIYKSIASDLQDKRTEREDKIKLLVDHLAIVLSVQGVNAKVTGRPKHIYGIYKKIQATGLPVSKINDVLGLRVITDTEDECYLALAIINKIWTPAQNVYEGNKPLRDWIAHPKPNGYQSIHTTVAVDNTLVEIQIRTQLMHEVAENGVAAHWIYRRSGNLPEIQEQYQKYVEIVAKYRKDALKHVSVYRSK